MPRKDRAVQATENTTGLSPSTEFQCRFGAGYSFHWSPGHPVNKKAAAGASESLWSSKESQETEEGLGTACEEKREGAF